jgi:uncharacterized protein YigE (DUF2233 family)
MSITKKAICILILRALTAVSEADRKNTENTERYIYHIVDASKGLKMYWKNEQGERYRSIDRLQLDMARKGKNMVFAMNGGMYKTDQTPLGLYVEKGKVLSKVNRVQVAFGNFYLQPNGVFYIDTSGKAGVQKTSTLKDFSHIKYATQSGPMLLVDGNPHPSLTKDSKNLHVRNGVGVMDDGRVIFAISRGKTNFYDFAMFFKEKGCKNALYLDGFVSRMFLPAKGRTQKGGNFAVIIAEVE